MHLFRLIAIPDFRLLTYDFRLRCMPKLKTHKATAKRFTITKNNKVIRRKAGQDHFNSRESGNTVRNKRRDILAGKADIKNIRSLMPYN